MLNSLLLHFAVLNRLLLQAILPPVLNGLPPGLPRISQVVTITSSDEQPGPDASGEEEPKKRRKHDQLVVSVEDVIIPRILQPIQKVLAQEIDTFKAEREQWDAPKFGDDAT